MKRITKVTTKTGDDGTTGMADGTRKNKSDDLLNAIGELDELNSWIGKIISLKEIKVDKQVLIDIQHCLFEIGGSLSTGAEESLTLDDIDFICWGPFTNPNTMCNQLTAGNVEDCSYSAMAIL